jgi:hypothetical protein
MVKGLVFLSVAIAAGIYGWNARSPMGSTVLLNGALCYTGVALAFMGQRPGLLLKRPNGTFPMVAWLLYWPYLALNFSVLWIVAHFSREHPADEIAPGLMLGRYRFPGEAAPSDLGAGAVLDMTCEFPRIPDHGLEEAYHLIPLLDSTAPTPGQLQAAVDWIQTHRESGVLVHCAAGHGRSATVVAACLLAEGTATSVDDAVGMVRAKRPGAQPNRGQREALEAFRRGTGSPE